MTTTEKNGQNVQSERFGKHLSMKKPYPNTFCTTETTAERKKCRYRTHMNQNNSNWSGLQKRIENTKTTLKEHKKEQRKKWNNKETQRMNIQVKYKICF